MRVAVTEVDDPAGTVPLASDSEMGVLETVICTLAETEASACAIADMVTVRSVAGVTAGAV